jgi:hypothetical protein
MRFDGVDDSVAGGTLSTFISDSAATIAAGIKPASEDFTASGVPNYLACIVCDSEYIGIFRGQYTGIGRDSIFVFKYDGSQDVLVADTGSVSVGSWSHVVLVHGGGNLYAYNNGVYIGSVPSGNTQDLSDSLSIGGKVGYFFGSLDDVRIYNRALSAAEVKRLYDLGAGTHISMTLTNPTLDSGLVGHWTFDGSDIDWSSTTAEIKDTSGNHNNGDAQGGMTADANVTPGKLGQGLSFNGSSNYLDAGAISGTVKTVSFWMRPSATASKKIVNIDGTKQIEINASHQIAATSFPNPTVYVDGAQASTMPDTEWHFVVVTDPTGVTASTVEIGKVGTSYFPGALDDVRIYNRALSAEEVRRLYDVGR